MRVDRWSVVLAMFGVVGSAHAQHPQTRQGFWLDVGFGYGSRGCDNCDGRQSGLSSNLALGGTVSRKVLLGGGTNAYTGFSTITAQVRFYPSATGGFFLTGGLGYGIEVHGSDSVFGSDSEWGAGALLGLGYNIRVGQNVSLTPYWNGFANADANVGQLGLAVTLH